jgi:glycosyltransferase involved in cell wall biosynthesis
VIFSGKLSYHANISAALFLVKQVMPIVWERRPQTRVLLAGKDPNPILLSLSKENHRVEITGTIPDLPSHIQSAAVSAATITYGAGVQNKVLEAMACATPVVATSKAVSALKAEPGYEALVADDPVGIATHILSLLDDEQMRQNIGQNGLNYVRRNHQWNSITSQLVTIYENILNRAS